MRTRVWIHASLWPNLRDDSLKFFSRLAKACDPITAALLATGRKSVSVADGLAMKGMRGHIVGSVEVHGYRTPEDPPDSPWYVPGSLAILVREPVPLSAPVPAKGALGWWTPSSDVLEQLRETG